MQKHFFRIDFKSLDLSEADEILPEFEHEFSVSDPFCIVGVFRIETDHSIIVYENGGINNFKKALNEVKSQLKISFDKVARSQLSIGRKTRLVL